MASVRVRQLTPVGARKVGDGYQPNAVGDEYDLEDEPLDAPAEGGPATLVELYVAAGYVELAE